MSLLESVLVAPVEALLSVLFEAFARVTGSYGAALILLSVAVTALMLPLYYLAERWKLQEQAVQRDMARDLASIRKHYTGQKRFYLIRNLYRLHGYRSVYALRTSLGLLIQIPFFFAAYNYLSGFEGYAGSRFAFVPDLGLPDGLLWGANLLPFVMTAVNIASSLLYTRLKSLGEAAQLLGLSLLFLVLLYDRPAGLLVYWTMNNLLAIPKNALLARILPAQPPAEDGPEASGAASLAPAVRAALGPENRDLLLFVLTAALLALQRYWQLAFDRSFKYAILITGILAFALSLLLAVAAARRGRAQPPRSALYRLAALWVLFGAAGYLLLFARRQNAYISNPNIKLLAILVLDAIAWTAAVGLTSRSEALPAVTLARRRLIGLFAAAWAFVVAYILLFSPALVFFSSPQDVGMGLAELLLRNGSAALGLVAAGALLCSLLGRRAQAGLLEGAVTLLLAVLAFNYLVPGDFGILDELHLEKAHLLENAALGRFLVDVAVIAAACGIARALVRRRPGALFPTLVVLAGALAVQTAVKGLNTERSAFASEAPQESSELPPEAERVHRFSRTGTNVVVLVADMFNGNYMERLLAEAPQYAAALDGFVWYRNTLSISSTTVTSMPSIFAGWKYAPEAMNAMPGTGRQKYEGALRDLLDTVLAAGREPALVNLTYLDKESLSAEAYGGRLAVSSASSYVGPWNRSQGRDPEPEGGSGKNRLLAMVALFQSAPYMLKAAVYDQGGWLVFRKSFQFRKMARNAARSYAYLDLLPQMSTAADTGPTFKLIHSQLTHEPFGITRDGRIIDDEFPDPDTRSFVDGTSAYYSAKKMIDLLLAWTAWMKREGVYGNTMIVVLSDHGNNAMDSGLKLPPGLDNLLNRWEVSKANALLLVKRFDAGGALRIDDRLLSNADIGGILFHAAASSDAAGPDLTRKDPPAGRVRTHARYYGNWSDFMAQERVRLSVYDVRGDMYDPDSWSKR